MRSDMHKVVVERPRGGQQWARQFPRPKRPFDDLPKHESMKAPHANRKWFTDVLGPLKRWLHIQIGRPWNDAYSEACAVIKPDSVVRAHIKTHLMEMVIRHTFMKAGEVWCYEGGCPTLEVPITQLAGRWRIAYVDPETGILRAMPVCPRKKPKPSDPDDSMRWVSESVGLKRIVGVWYFCQMRPVPGRGHFTAYDHLAKRVVGRGELQTKWNRQRFTHWHCHAVRQLSTQDLRRHGLTNHAPGQDGLPCLPESEPPKTVLVLRARLLRSNPQPIPAMPNNRFPEDVAPFEITSKRRNGFPSENRVGKGVRIVHGDKELTEKLGRNDPCPCGSSPSFQAMLPALRAS
jgi:hypothetical protein